ncbi:beclin-1-like protein isoform X2 [Bradysia coprophila]|nr:beclin-1-like protein isoform X2 [Bradysia coprophila]
MLISDGKDSQTLSATLKARADLFDSLSSNSEIDHPLCDECTDTLLDLMDHQLKIADNEWKDYNNYLQKLKETDDSPNIELLEKELSDLDDEERRLIDELKKLNREEEAVQASISLAEKERDRLDAEREKFRREYTKHKRNLMLTEDEYRSLDCQLAYVNSQLDKLKKTNIFNVTFHIWHAGHFGTINNFRLGRLPSSPVDWSEINAAWGQTALLLSALARKVNLTFKKYRLVPFGNHSYIEVIGEGKELPLYGTGGFKFFWDTKFDAAMVAFLDCLTQFKEKVETVDKEFYLPYLLRKGKIEDSTTGNSYSIKIQFNSEEQWTKALKFLLTNLKWGLAWVSSQFTNEKIDLPTELASAL